MKLITLFVNIIDGLITYTAIALFYSINKKFGIDPLICFVLCVLFLVGVFISINGLFCMPWKEQTTVTDQIAVSKNDDKYFVKKDDKKVEITKYEEVEKINNNRYRLKTTKYYGILGTDIRKKNTLIVIVDTKIIQ